MTETTITIPKAPETVDLSIIENVTATETKPEPKAVEHKRREHHYKENSESPPETEETEEVLEEVAISPEEKRERILTIEKLRNYHHQFEKYIGVFSIKDVEDLSLEDLKEHYEGILRARRSANQVKKVIGGYSITMNLLENTITKFGIDMRGVTSLLTKDEDVVDNLADIAITHPEWGMGDPVTSVAMSTASAFAQVYYYHLSESRAKRAAEAKNNPPPPKDPQQKDATVPSELLKATSDL